METTRRAIRARDMVKLITAVGRWPAGTTGTVVSDYGDVKLIEVGNGADTALDYLSVAEPRLKLVDADAGSTLP